MVFNPSNRFEQNFVKPQQAITPETFQAMESKEMKTTEQIHADILNLLTNDVIDQKPEQNDLPYITEILKSNLREISKKQNQALREINGADFPSLLNERSMIVMGNYQKIYGKEAITADKKKVQEIEWGFLTANDDKNTLQHKIDTYKTKYKKSPTENDLILEWKKEHNENKSKRAEIAISLLLNHFLGDEFVIASSTEFDDYTHKTDKILIHKKTGQTICALDDLYNDRKDLKRAEDKLKSFVEIAKKGGNTVKYGLKLNAATQKMELSGISNIPNYFLSINNNELAGIIIWLKKQKAADNPPQDEMKKIFHKLIKLIITQSEYLLRSIGPAKNETNLIRKNLENTIKLLNPYLAV